MTDMSIPLLLLLFVLPGAVSGQNSNAPWWFSSPPPDDPLSSTQSFHPKMVVVIMVLICAFFFLGFIVIYMRQCQNESRSDLPFHARLMLSRSVHRGLDSNVIESFPTFTYSAVKGLKIGKSSLECAVCLSEFQDDDKLRLLPQCSHAFHPECIDEWLSSHVTCPVCRANLREDSGTAVAESVLVDIPGEANDPEGDRQEDAGRSGMLNHVAAGALDVEPNSNVVPSAGVALPKAKSLRFLPENASTKNGTKPSMLFPRSHSTGHSLHPPESYERFTLRLPENVRREIISGQLNRAASCTVFGGRSRSGRRVGDASSRSGRGIRRGWDESTRSERWTFSITPPFIHRSSSSRSHRGAAVADSSSTSKPTSLPPFDRTGSRADAAGRSSGSATTSVQFQA
ncbi:E3 ubiquitin-protein ligase ATL31-like [Nymphaea colorata]|nr:E3 ubiquitin-protein ligase ATL31-like [Nymphaea colorata]